MSNFPNNYLHIRLQYEDWAFHHGFTSEIQVALVADFLQGMDISSPNVMYSLPKNTSLPDNLRAVFVNAGKCLSILIEKVTDNDITKHLEQLFTENKDKINKVLGEIVIMPGTGDCRGACKYNTGDRSMYRNYGWS